jgi:LacI family transcriptional regulator
VPFGDGPQPFLVAPDQDRLGVEAGAVLEPDAALLSDGEQRPHQVLPVPHPAGDAVQGDGDDLAFMALPFYPEHLGKVLSQTRLAPDGRSSEERGVHQVRRVTLQDVADRAGVSLTTASRVVNEGARRVGPAAGAARQPGRHRARLHRQPAGPGGRHRAEHDVGVVVHDIADPYFSSIAAGLIEAAEARQLLVCMSSTAATEVAEREYVALMRAQRARAVILIGSRTDDTAAREALRAEIAAFTGSGGRAVAVGQDLLGVDTVLPENAAGAEALARAMVAVGHRRFAVLAGPRDLLTARDRLDGFRAGLAAWNVPLEAAQVVYGPFTRDGGYEAMSAVLAAAGPEQAALPDCVFAVTDVMAMGALARLRAGGLAVPADIALAGFDDIARCATSTRR